MKGHNFITGLSILLIPIQVSAVDPISNLAGQPDATSVILNWDPYSGGQTLTEYRVKRNGVSIGSTISKYGYFTDSGLSPNTTYSYLVEGLGTSNNVICQSETIQVHTTTQTSIKTHYKLLAVVFDPGSVLHPELNHIRTFLRYRLDFLKYASHNSVLLDIYNDDIITIDAFPQLEPYSNYVSYKELAVTSFNELNGSSFVDLVEKYDIDIIWVLGAPEGYNFGENVLIGNKDLGNNTWISTKVKCSRSFFIHSNSPDARAFDAAAHHVEGTMTSASDKDPVNWPRDKEYLVYTKVRDDYSVYPAKLHLFEQFRLTDEWTGTGAYSSKGNANCGSSHFVPGSIRNSVNYPDYTYYDIEAWQRYVDCYADEWLNYPNFSGTSRKLNGYDFGAFNNYSENHSTHSFGFGTSSFHLWWFNHIPHNPGVTDGKLNNWWPYIYDCDRFNGTAIDYPVHGFPVAPSTYNITDHEFGTEAQNTEAWGFWHTCTDFGQRADLNVVNKTASPEYVKCGQYSIKVDLDVESFSYNGRNDLIYPRFKNAHWRFSDMDSLSLSVKFKSQSLINGTNPIIRLCKNGNNRIEFVPIKNGVYTNLFNDNALRDSDGWFTFKIPLFGNDEWERNVIGYIDPESSVPEQEQANRQIIHSILEDVNYIEISIQSDGGRGQSIEYFVDELKLHSKAVATINFEGLTVAYDGTPKEVTVATDPAGLDVELTYNGSAIPPVNSGTYEVVGTIDDLNYQGRATGELVITKALATVDLDNLETTYDGMAKTVTARTIPAGMDVKLTYNGSAIPPVNSGTYEVVGTIDDLNYEGRATGELVITKALATVDLDNLETTYDGMAKTVTARTIHAGMYVKLTYDGSAVTPVNAGTYKVLGTIIDDNFEGSAFEYLIINKASATLELVNLTSIYNGTPKPVIAKTVPTGLTVFITYNNSDNLPIHGGIYEVLAKINDPNYQGDISSTLKIFKAPLIAAAEDKMKNVGEENPDFTIVYSGFVNNETEQVLDITPTPICTANASSGPGVYEIGLIDGEDNDYDFTYIPGKLTINPITSLIKSGSSDPQIFPNPVLNYFTIKSPEEDIINIRIYDVRGHLVFESKLQGCEVNVQSLAPGLYILNINAFTIKLVKR